jgi:hypothetical protein
MNANEWGDSSVTPCFARMLKFGMKIIRPRVTILGDATAAMIVYKITNTVTGRSYIGISTRSLGRRVREHVYEALCCGSMNPLHVSMRNRGLEVFTAEVLEQHADLDALNAAEIRLIAQHGTFGLPRGYNQTAGGGGLMGIESTWTTARNRANRKLTEDDIRAILLDTRPGTELAAEYGIARSTITQISRGLIYKDLYDKVCATLPPEVVERNLKFRTNPRPHKTGDLHHMRRDPELARRLGETKRGKKNAGVGESNKARRSLTEDDIRMILTDPRNDGQIAGALGLGRTIIWNIRAGRKYADVVAKIRSETK